MKENTDKPRRACISDVLAKIKHNDERNKNYPFYLYEDPADYVTIGAIKAVKLG
ncbi:hypothetical protein [Robertmurraya andreesenii]|uniref:Uncharacterized protein n=1 Tax=Anoxybacillus andreesenii TaxID=1325932 RepID=A0ABT9V225_9BACL|nr:hypothetical protein [Robertmurraya andreesenii]MDQ0154966.1 hypothetical protein [Robertmurraya andreesenii]